MCIFLNIGHYILGPPPMSSSSHLLINITSADQPFKTHNSWIGGYNMDTAQIHSDHTGVCRAPASLSSILNARKKYWIRSRSDFLVSSHADFHCPWFQIWFWEWCFSRAASRWSFHNIWRIYYEGISIVKSQLGEEHLNPEYLSVRPQLWRWLL